VVGASTENIIGGITPLLTPYDLKRLESYASNLVDYHLVRYPYSFLSSRMHCGSLVNMATEVNSLVIVM
jgi:tRNA(Met) C34 N-acetyltransferase TmcA